MDYKQIFMSLFYEFLGNTTVWLVVSEPRRFDLQC